MEEKNEKLKSLILDCTLTEELSYGNNCYMYHVSNIVLIHEFKKMRLAFLKGPC